MRRPVVALLAATALAMVACTAGTASSPAPVSPAAVGLPSSDGVDDRIVEVVRRVLPAVVNVTTDQLGADPLGGSQPGQGVGTGFIVSPDGYIVTNYHVVENAQRIRVITSGEDPQEYEARVVGGQIEDDVAVLKVDAEGLPTVPIGSSADLELGQRVIALGYALALEGGPSVTTGIVSSLNRVIQANDPGCLECDPPGVRKYGNVVQTDAAINPGNSGGPLVDLDGRVVGINSAGAGEAENIGFAIAIDVAWPIISYAIENPEAAVAYLGVVSRTVDDALVLELGLDTQSGAYIVAVSPGGPAEGVGIREGDVIVLFDGEPVQSSEQLGELIRDHRPGDRLEMALVGAGGARTVSIRLGVNPDPTRA